MPRFERPVCGMFFWDDFSNDPVVVAMDDAARGIYMMLLCSLWFQPVPGTVEENIPVLARLSRTTPEQITKFWPQIKPAFKEVEGEGMLMQERLVHTYKKALDSLLGNRERKAKWRGNKFKTNNIKNGSGTVPGTFPERSGSVSVSVSNKSFTKKEKRKVSTKPNGESEGEKLVFEFPKNLDNEDFKPIWSEWVEFRMEKKPCNNWDRLFKKQLKNLSRFGCATAIEMINQSIREDWQGLFPFHEEQKSMSKGLFSNESYAQAKVRRTHEAGEEAAREAIEKSKEKIN